MITWRDNLVRLATYDEEAYNVALKLIKLRRNEAISVKRAMNYVFDGTITELLFANQETFDSMFDELTQVDIVPANTMLEKVIEDLTKHEDYWPDSIKETVMNFPHRETSVIRVDFENEDSE